MVSKQQNLIITFFIGITQSGLELLLTSLGLFIFILEFGIVPFIIIGAVITFIFVYLALLLKDKFKPDVRENLVISLLIASISLVITWILLNFNIFEMIETLFGQLFFIFTFLYNSLLIYLALLLKDR